MNPNSQNTLDSKKLPKLPEEILRSHKWMVISLTVLISTCLIFSFITPSFGEIQDHTSKPKITQTSKIKMNSSYFFFFKYCPTQNSSDVKGFLVSSEPISIPVIVSQNTKSGQCQTYGVKVLTDKPNSVKTQLILKKDIPDLIKDFEAKKKTFESQFVKESQKLNNYHKGSTSDKKITEQTKTVENLKEIIKSARSSIILLKST